MREDALLTGPLEPTNQWYAVAKISGVKLCRAYRLQYACDFISAMPTNLYGIGDNFDLASSHVIPALIAKAHAAKMDRTGVVEVWGSGTPRREFLEADDLADALVFLLRHYSGESHVNVGTGSDITIRELAEMVMRVVGVEGRLRFDQSKPDGTPQKLLDFRFSAFDGMAPTHRSRRRSAQSLCVVSRKRYLMSVVFEPSTPVADGFLIGWYRTDQCI